ncbi:SIR2 family protein [Chloroflexi bacterium TSY]|nr:SIR2 family protein [Chloroflexi bacterium TSY]
MSRAEEFAKRKRKQAQQAERAGFWPELCRRIAAGEVIPIISNAVFIDPIFDIDGAQILGISRGEELPFDWSIEEQLADTWAKIVEFPLAEQHWMPRVALYDRVVNSQDNRHAKTRYLHFLKEFLLDLAKDDPQLNGSEIIADLQADINALSFSDIVIELGYPRAVSGWTDPIQRLAKLHLPIYITTSYFDFLERAIKADGRSPRTQICFWSKAPINLEKEHVTEYDFVPTPREPLVYHIFGLEKYPESLVLNEDDYLDFLASISQDVGQDNPILPFYLRQALTQSSLILLGYRLRDWDFRVLFRGIIGTMPFGLRQFSLAIQLDPRKQRQIVSARQVMDYLEQYFGSSNFSVEWETSHDFIENLWTTWQQWQR